MPKTILPKLRSACPEQPWTADPTPGVDELICGLQATDKSLPSKYFYDEQGSRLFEEITALEEYYPSRTERLLMTHHAPEIMDGAEGASLIELGSGDCSKISILLEALSPEKLSALTYVPVDVSQSAIEESKGELLRRFPGLSVQGMVADFMQQFQEVTQFKNKVLCFFGSTIGNLEREEAIDFMTQLGELMEPGERLLLGLDMVKDKKVLERAYNDERGLTDRFNKNILNATNRILNTDFDPEQFRHRAFFDDKLQRIEMHLVAKRELKVSSALLDEDILFAAGESIHTESSHKFTFDHVEQFAAAGDLKVRTSYTDRQRWFTLVDYIK